MGVFGERFDFGVGNEIPVLLREHERQLKDGFELVGAVRAGRVEGDFLDVFLKGFISGLMSIKVTHFRDNILISDGELIKAEKYLRVLM